MRVLYGLDAVTMKLEQVSKRYGWRQPLVVSGIDLELDRDSLTLLAGANGSGKTTLLRIIAGLTMPSGGAVRGRPRRVAVVPDRFVPPARMTARSLLSHYGRIRGLDTHRATERAVALGEQFGVVPGIGVPLQDLSKGNLQKIALAQAFIAPVDLLVLDEPRTALDARAAAALDVLLRDVRGTGTIVVLTDPTPGAHYDAATRYEVAEGHLRLMAAAPAVGVGQVTVRLRPRDGDYQLELPESLTALAFRMSRDETGMTVVVEPGHSDDLLVLAIKHGWSVLDMSRDGPGGGAG
jgi:ABC-type Mn2+/Zn2+ transport system ATPase subunit